MSKSHRSSSDATILLFVYEWIFFYENCFIWYISIFFTDVNPVPKLLVVSSNQLFTEEMDSVGNRTVLLEHIPPPVTVTFLARDNKMFWVDKNNVLFEESKESKKQVDTVVKLKIYSNSFNLMKIIIFKH